MQNNKPFVPHSISEAEFEITTQILDFLGFYIDENEIWNESGNMRLSRNNKPYVYTETYAYVNDLNKKTSRNIIRPFYVEKDADILIEEALYQGLINYDFMEISEFVNNKGHTKYTGYLLLNGEEVPNSRIKSSPSIAILKMSIMAQLAMDENEHNKYLYNLKNLLKRKSKKGDEENGCMDC